jgi:hypothetical protein
MDTNPAPGCRQKEFAKPGPVDVLHPRSIIALAHIRALTAVRRIKPTHPAAAPPGNLTRQTLHFLTRRFCSATGTSSNLRTSLACNSPAIFRIEEMDEARVRGERKSVAGLHCEALAE